MHGRERAERALAIAARTNGRPAEHFARAALGLLEQSVGRPAEVVRALGPLVDFLRAEQITEPGTARVVPDQVEALIALGELAAAERAARLVRGERAAAGPAGPRWPPRRAAAGCSPAPRGDVDGAVAELRERASRCTRASRSRSSWPARSSPTARPCAARARRRAAREALEAARDGFDAIGARVWADARARPSSARVGGRPPSSGALTPTERRVAELVAQGLQTKQVAGRLFVSPKTVEGHLSRIYGKLGVGSRTELAHRLGDGDS